MARAPVFSQNKGNWIKFTKPLFRRTFIHCAMVFSFILYYVVSFCLQNAYRKVKNLQICVNKLIRKVSLNLLCHPKFIMSHKVSCLCNQHNYLCLLWFSCQICTPKQIDLICVLSNQERAAFGHACLVSWNHFICERRYVCVCVCVRPWGY